MNLAYPVSVRLTSSELQRIEATAKNEGINRHRVLRRLIEANFDQLTSAGEGCDRTIEDFKEKTPA